MRWFNKLRGGTARKKRVVVIGLDGVPYTYIQRLFQAGELPNFRAIVGEGALVQMDTTSPKQEVFINTWLHDAG
jgi:predicted AlkP superfamily phosphohydrolase/phosphomutase